MGDELLVFSDDKCINLEEFEKLSYIVSMPFVKLNDADHKWRCSIFFSLFISPSIVYCRFQRVRAFIDSDLTHHFKPLRNLFLSKSDLEEATKQEKDLVTKKQNVENIQAEHAANPSPEISGRLKEAKKNVVEAEKQLETKQRRTGTSTYGLLISSLILFSIINALYIHPGRQGHVNLISPFNGFHVAAPSTIQALDAIECHDSSNVFSMFFGMLSFEN